MNPIRNAALLFALALLPLASCNRNGAVKPLDRPSVDLPKDDGRVFQPTPKGAPVPAPRRDALPSGGSRNRSGGPVGDPGGGDHAGGGKGSGGNPPPPSVPEPGTLLLVGAGLAASAMLRRKRGEPTDLEREED